MPAISGSKHHSAKMTEATVRAARRSFEKGGQIVVDGKRQPVSANTLAKKYGVTHQTMRAILTRRTWKHVQ